jgi:hypothetical protein
MAKTKVGLVSSEELEVDGSIGEVKMRIGRARGRWASFTREGRQIEIDAATVAYLEEIPGGDTTLSQPEAVRAVRAQRAQRAQGASARTKPV